MDKAIHYKKLMKVHHDFLEWVYFHQYDELFGRENIFPSLDRHTEYDEEGVEYYCYFV